MESLEAIKSCAALAHSVRMDVFRVLVMAGNDGMTPGALTEALGVAGTTLSFHLKELLLAELVTQERSKRNLVYRANYAQMDGLVAFLRDSCCAGVRRRKATGSSG